MLLLDITLGPYPIPQEDSARSYILVFDNDEERSLWTDSIRDAIASLAESMNVRYPPLTYAQQTWKHTRGKRAKKTLRTLATLLRRR